MNAIDRRRRLGPATAIPLTFPSAEVKLSQETEKKDSKLFIQLSNIPTATGSSFIQSGNNLLLASVYGPRPSFKRTFNSKAVLKITFHSSPFLSSSQATGNDSNNSSSGKKHVGDEFQIVNSVISSTLETACSNLILLDNYPKSTIDIFVNLISTDTATKFTELLPLIHNAVNLALVDSGIAIKGFPSAIISENNIFINSIHSDTYDQDQHEDLENEELLTFYIPHLPSNDEKEFKLLLSDAIGQSRSLRSELSQFCCDKL
mgnify:CR=1 FL=1